MSKESIKNEAFLDLEDGFTGQLLPVWTSYWKGLSLKIGQAADEQDWDEAHLQVDTLDIGKVLAKRGKLLDTLGMAALLLGASRLGKVNQTSVYTAPPKDWLSAAQAQTAVMLGTNASTALKHELHLLLDNREYAEAPSNSATLAEVMKAQQLQPLSKQLRAVGTKRATNYIGLAANLQTSRLSTAGFLLEATAADVRQYQISELLDSRICRVCERMHGQTFAVEAGLSHLSNVFSVTDPKLLATVSPWPRQSASGLQAFLRLDNGGLRDAGYHLPPFHPGCRGIVVPVGTVDVVQIDDTIAAAVAGMLSADSISDRLFGNRSDLAASAAGLYSTGAVSSTYEDEANESDADDGMLALGVALGTTAAQPKPAQ